MLADLDSGDLVKYRHHPPPRDLGGVGIVLQRFIRHSNPQCWVLWPSGKVTSQTLNTLMVVWLRRADD